MKPLLLSKTLLILLSTLFFVMINPLYAQKVGVGTTNPDAKLHVAGDLKVDSSLIVEGIILEDSTGDIRLRLDPNKGAIQWWHRDSLFYEISVNSPTRQTYKLPDGGRVERSTGKSDLPLSNTNEDVTAYYDKNGQLKQAISRYEDGAYHPLGKLIFEDVTYDNDTTCRTYSFERIRTSSGEIIEYKTWFKCLGEFSSSKTKQICDNPRYTVTTHWNPLSERITSWHMDLKERKKTVTDSISKKILEITEVPNEGESGITHKDSTGTKLGAATIDFPDNDKDNGKIEWVGPQDGTFTFKFSDTIPDPPLSFPENFEFKVDQDNGRLTISNIGSSGCDGVTIDIGDDGNPKFQLFNETEDGLFDLLWELDSQTKDGLIRITDPVTGEVIVVGLDPNTATFELGSSGDEGFKFELPTEDENSVEVPTFRLFGENNEGAAIRVTDTVPPVGIAKDMLIDIDQDNRTLRVGNIGSSGMDGVRVDLGEEGKPGFQIFNESEDGLFDLKWEIDSQEKDGLLRMTDPVTGEVIVIGIDPNIAAFDIGSSGNEGFKFELPTEDENSVEVPTFRLFGENNEGVAIRVTDTVPPVGIAKDMLIDIDQDNRTLRVGNIGSSGLDGVRVDLGEEGKPGFQIFNESNDGLFDLMWEIDSQEKDGLLRMTDPVTGEVIVIGIDPNAATFDIGSSGEDGVTIDLGEAEKPTTRFSSGNMEAEDVFDADGGLIVRTVKDSMNEAIEMVLDLTAAQWGLTRDQLLYQITIDPSLGEKVQFRIQAVTSHWVEIHDLVNGARSTNVGGALSQNSIFDESNGVFLFQATKSDTDKVQIVFIPEQDQIDFFAGNTPGMHPVNTVIHGNAVVMGDLQVNGNKNFKIDHPLDPYNKYLIHSCLESPDAMNVYNGNIETNNDGFATVQLPDYFEALNSDYRYQLTVIGTFAQAIIKEKIVNNRFVIQTSESNVEVSWQITGIRQDAAALHSRSPVEFEKEEGMKGQLLFNQTQK